MGSWNSCIFFDFLRENYIWKDYIQLFWYHLPWIAINSWHKSHWKWYFNKKCSIVCFSNICRSLLVRENISFLKCQFTYSICLFCIAKIFKSNKIWFEKTSPSKWCFWAKSPKVPILIILSNFCWKAWNFRQLIVSTNKKNTFDKVSLHSHTKQAYYSYPHTLFLLTFYLSNVCFKNASGSPSVGTQNVKIYVLKYTRYNDERSKHLKQNEPLRTKNIVWQMSSYPKQEDHHSQTNYTY